MEVQQPNNFERIKDLAVGDPVFFVTSDGREMVGAFSRLGERGNEVVVLTDNEGRLFPQKVQLDTVHKVTSESLAERLPKSVSIPRGSARVTVQITGSLWDTTQNKVFLQWTENGNEVGSYFDFNKIGIATAEQVTVVEKALDSKPEVAVEALPNTPENAPTIVVAADKEKEVESSITPALESVEVVMKKFDFRNLVERNDFDVYVRERVHSIQSRVWAQFEKNTPAIGGLQVADGDILQAIASAHAFYKGNVRDQLKRYENSLRDPSKKPLDVAVFTKQILHTYEIIKRQLAVVEAALVATTRESADQDIDLETIPSSVSVVGVTESVPVVENVAFDAEKTRADMIAWLQESGFAKKHIQIQIQKIDEAIARHKTNPDECKKQLQIIDERLKLRWNEENKKPLISASEIEAQADAVDAFLRLHVRNRELSNDVRDKLVENRKALLRLYQAIQAVAEPNPRESDAVTRETILRKYSNQAQSIFHWLQKTMNQVPALIPGVADVVESRAVVDKMTDTVVTEEVLPIVSEEIIVSPEALTAEKEDLVQVPSTPVLPDNSLTVETVSSEATTAEPKESETPAFIRPSRYSNKLVQFAEEAQGEDIYASEEGRLSALSEAKLVQRKSEASLVDVATESPVEHTPPILGTLFLSSEDRVISPASESLDTPALHEIEDQLRVPTDSPTGPAVALIRTEDVPVSEAAPNIKHTTNMTERSRTEGVGLPIDERLRTLRQAKDAYVAALMKAIRFKTIPQRREYAGFQEGALAAVETTEKVYKTLFSNLTYELAQNVSSKFALQKDAQVTQLERDFFHEPTTLAQQFTNIARLFGKRIKLVPEHPVTRPEAQPLRTESAFEKSPIAPLPGVTRPSILIETPDENIDFIKSEQNGDVSFEQYRGVEKVPLSEYLKPDTEIQSGLLDLSDEAREPVSRIDIEAVAESVAKSELTLPKIYGYLNQFPGGKEALSDNVKEWIYTTEGLFGSRQNTLGRSFFTSAQLTTPYEALKSKTVQEILSLKNRKSGAAHALEELHITSAGFAVWADRIAQFILNHPDIDIHRMPLREVVEILYATEQLGRGA